MSSVMRIQFYWVCVDKSWEGLECLWSTVYNYLVQDRSKPVPVEEFSEHVQRMHADRDKFFELEYNVSLPIIIG